MSKKLSIMADFEFFQKVWYKAGNDGTHREGLVTAIRVAPCMDVLYEVTWHDGSTTENYPQELTAEQPKEWVQHE
jgi:hypothetical protein